MVELSGSTLTRGGVREKGRTASVRHGTSWVLQDHSTPSGVELLFGELDPSPQEVTMGSPSAPNGIVLFSYPSSPFGKRVSWYLQLRGIGYAICVSISTLCTYQV